MLQKPVANPFQVTKQVQKNSFISHALSDQVWWCNIKRFLSYSKNYICKFMQIDEIKNFFLVFEGLSFGEKKYKFHKNSRHKL